uniref:Uncharacterized protein n=1 Tax=Sus scrofa TaxID=9823 RepID=A0A8D1VCG9_PIG
KNNRLRQSGGNLVGDRHLINLTFMVPSLLEVLGLFLLFNYIKLFLYTQLPSQLKPLVNVKRQYRKTKSENKLVVTSGEREGGLKAVTNTISINCEGLNFFSFKGYFSTESILILQRKKGRKILNSYSYEKSIGNIQSAELYFKSYIFFQITGHSPSC